MSEPFWSDGAAAIWHGDALDLPLPDESVDLIVTSPPYFGLRSYQDGGEHYAGQIGSEATPAEFVDVLIAATREMMRVLKPSGSIFVNLGDKYSSGGRGTYDLDPGRREVSARRPDDGARSKSLLLIPERYRIACVDELGLIARAVICWDKPNGLPESVTDRVRRSHEDWVHLTRRPKYYSAIDTIREAHLHGGVGSSWTERKASGQPMRHGDTAGGASEGASGPKAENPLGKLPGSVWRIPTQPFKVPEHIAHEVCCGGRMRPGCDEGLDHYACVDTETEMLTTRGWLRWDEVRAGDTAAGYDLDTGTSRWTQVHAVNSYDYDGELVAVEKRDLSMRLTPNHRTIVQKRQGIHGHRGPVGVVRADELRPQHFIPRSSAWDESSTTKSIGVDLAALCGWVAAEGWINWRRVMLSQSLDVNPANVATIDALVQRLGGTTYTARQRKWRERPWTECVWSLPRDLSADLLRLMPGKRLSWEMLGLPEDERRALLMAFVAGDGHVRADGRIGIYQKIDNAITVDVLQAIAVTLGYKTTRTSDGERWVLYLTTGGRSVTLRGSNGALMPVGRERYVGKVWCPTTGTGTFVARRNGRVFITGNSYPMEWPRRIIRGWSPRDVCTACGEGRRPVARRDPIDPRYLASNAKQARNADIRGASATSIMRLGLQAGQSPATFITGYVCACTPYTDHPGSEEKSNQRTDNPYGDPGREQGVYSNKAGEYERVGPWREYHHDRWTPAETTPGVILDPFGGTGTTALVATVEGRTAHHVDLSADYCRLARWRLTDPGERARAMQVEKPKVEMRGQDDLFSLL